MTLLVGKQRPFVVYPWPKLPEPRLTQPLVLALLGKSVLTLLVLAGQEELIESKRLFSKCSLHYRHILSASSLLFFLCCHDENALSLSYWSYWGEVKVVVDLHQWYVELGDLEDTCGFVGGWVEFLQFQLPL